MNRFQRRQLVRDFLRLRLGDSKAHSGQNAARIMNSDWGVNLPAYLFEDALVEMTRRGEAVVLMEKDREGLPVYVAAWPES